MPLIFFVCLFVFVYLFFVLGLLFFPCIQGFLGKLRWIIYQVQNTNLLTSMNHIISCLFLFVFVFSSPLFRPEALQIGSVSWDDCGWWLNRIVRTLRPLWVKGVCMFRYNLPPVPLAKWMGSFPRHVCNMGVEGHQIKVSTQSQPWREREKKKAISNHSGWGFNLWLSNQESGTLATELSQSPSRQGHMHQF